jgi:hypothetical protein
VFGNDTLPSSCCPVLAAGATCHAKTDDPTPSDVGCLEAIISNLDPVFISVLIVAILEVRFPKVFRGVGIKTFCV